MALIGKIREKSWLLLVVVGIAMLAFILPWDTIFNRNSGPQETIGNGTVNGQKINGDYLENIKNNVLNQTYQTKLQQAQTEEQKKQVQITDQDIKSAESQAWNGAVAQMLLDGEYDKLGLTVGEEELDGLLYGEDGMAPSPIIAPYFKDSVTNEFSPEIARNYFETNPQSDDVKNSIIQQALATKYAALLSNGIQATTVEGKNEYQAVKTVKNVTYVAKRFNEIPATDITFSDDELKAYYEEHKNEEKYKQEGLRKISYFEVPESSATVRHILLSAKTDEEFAAAEVTADSLVNVIKAENNFEDMVVMFSDDPGSKDNGGVYKDFGPGQMVPPFNDFSFNEAVGTLGFVKTTYGIHVIEVLGRNKREESDVAEMIFELSDAIDGLGLAEKSVMFDSLVREKGLQIRTAQLKDKSPEVPQMGANAESAFIKLAYTPQDEVGMINSFPIRDNGKFIVAFYADKKAEGISKFNDVKKRIESEVRKEKQAAMIVSEMNGETNIEALAAKLGKEAKSEGVTFNANNIAGLGREPNFVGAVFSGLKEGDVTAPIVGNNSVYVIRIDNVVAADETTDYSTEVESLRSKGSANLASRYQQALIKSADVNDNRALSRSGVRP